MIRTLITVLFYALYTPIAALVAFPWTFITGKVEFLYRAGMWGAFTGVRLAGIKLKLVGRDGFDHAGTYIFMCNHVSNVDPPLVVPMIPRRTSVLVKKEIFRIPILARAMRMVSLVEVDRSNRDASIASLGRAGDVLRSGINLTVFPEGTRSRDGQLQPFKKGPFYVALDAQIPIIPMTILGTRAILPKGKWRMKGGTATLIFHPPLHPRDFPDRDSLMEAVRARIAEPLASSPVA